MWSKLGKWLLGAVWALIGVLVLIEYWRWIGLPATSQRPLTLAGFEALIGLAIIIILLVLAALVVWRVYTEAPNASAEEGAAHPAPDAPIAFPSPFTFAIGIWLMLTAVGFVAAFFALASTHSPDSSVQPYSDTIAALYMVVAAGIGASVTAVSSYSYHACEKRDYKVSFDGWYISRPFLAVLLALVFFFGIKAGFMLTDNAVSPKDAATLSTPTTATAGVSEGATSAAGATGTIAPSASATPSSDATGSPVAAGEAVPGYLFFAFAGALVGMFSKPAAEKLRELFGVIFQTSTAVKDEAAEKLPDEIAEKLKPFLKDTSADRDPVAGLIKTLKDPKLAKEIREQLEARGHVSFALPEGATEEDRVNAMTTFYGLLSPDLRGKVRRYVPQGAVDDLGKRPTDAGPAGGSAPPAGPKPDEL